MTRLKLIVLTGVLGILPMVANAGRITMSNPDESTTDSGKTLCVYQNSQYTFTYVTKGECPYSKTFNTEDSE